MAVNKFTLSSFLEVKEKGEKISMLTAYDYTTAKLLDESGIDSILVGDSLGMVMLGYENTLQVTVDDIVHHCRAVARGVKRAMVIGDMPFLSYHVSTTETIKNAGRIIQEGMAHAVKLEGGSKIIDEVKALVDAQIPVVGHLGLTPQSVNMLGGYKVRGKTEEEARQLIEDALLLQEAGVFALVLECVPEKISKIITEKLAIPTIGIGAGRWCDGQVLVIQDMLGMYNDFTPKFVKKYADLSGVIKGATLRFTQEIQNGDFPTQEHGFSIKEEVLEKLY